MLKKIHLACLNPVMMATKKEDCFNKFKKVLTLLLNYGRVEDKDCDTLLQQYGMFVDNICLSTERALPFVTENFIQMVSAHGRLQQMRKGVALLEIQIHLTLFCCSMFFSCPLSL